MAPDILYQQNHCGIYRMDRPEGALGPIGEKMPKSVGDIGFPMVLHPRDPDTAWVFPMDGTQVWPRTRGQARRICHPQRQRHGNGRTKDCPLNKPWFTVFRQAMTADARDPVGIYFGTTSGEVWASANEGEKWSCIARHLPHIYAVEAAERTR